MFSVASLLNPVKIDPQGTPVRLMCKSSSSSPKLPSLYPIKKHKISKDPVISSEGVIRGDICYPPFEDLDEETIQKVKNFHVYPLGKIKEYSRHIPYNSGKKSFLKKTGRESFEDDKDYMVMWDYNIGLVRMTPFFKCCKYTKTTPARMLGLNPGLKEITHSITGGALAAQGYWMPFKCARDICATFCHHISPALIPLFGPSFPSLCVRPEAPQYGRMIISFKTIAEATIEAESLRPKHCPFCEAKTITPPRSPCSCSHISLSGVPLNLSADHRIPLKRDMISRKTDREIASSIDYYPSPITPPGSQLHQKTCATPSNSSKSIISLPHGSFVLNDPHPLLVAIPRPISKSGVSLGCQGKFENSHVSSQIVNKITDPLGTAFNTEGGAVADDAAKLSRKIPNFETPSELSSGPDETKAAYSLIKLSIKEFDVESQDDEAWDGPRVKRQRAASA